MSELYIYIYIYIHLYISFFLSFYLQHYLISLKQNDKLTIIESIEKSGYYSRYSDDKRCTIYELN